MANVLAEGFPIRNTMKQRHAMTMPKWQLFDYEQSYFEQSNTIYGAPSVSVSCQAAKFT